MCAVAFMPMLNGEAFAAAKVKTPAKVVVKTAKQSGNTMKVKVTWKKANNAKTYNIKIDKKVVKKNVKKLTYTSAALKAGKHKVYVQGVNGKKTGKWSKAKAFTIVDKKAAKVTVEGEAVVGATLTATVTNKAGGVLKNATYQWYRVNNSNNVETEIPGATEATYTITAADYTTSFASSNSGYQIFVKATAGGKTVSSTKTVIVTPGYYAQLNDDADKAVTTPCVGQTVYADIYNAVTNETVGGAAQYQWYVDGVALKGMTGYSFTITADELGKTIECKIVYQGKEYTTGVSAPVVKSTIPEEVTISGASGKAGDYQVPTVGDTLTAAFTKPENAADPDATYQWYVGATALKGETKATYTVQKEDVGSQIRVEVTLSNKDVLYDVTAPVVANKLSSSEYTAVVFDTANEQNTVFTKDLTVKAKVYKNSDTTKADKFTDVAGGIEWYIDSVKTENQLWADGAAVDSQTLALDGAYGTTKDGKAATFKALENGLVGHTLIAVVVGNNYDYAGSVTSAAIGPVGVKIAAPAIALNGASSDEIVVGVTTLKAEFEDANTTATYKWYKSTDEGANYTAIAGATSDSYAPTAQDAYDKVNMYKVAVTGTGNYVGTAEAECDAYFASSTATVDVNISILNEQGTPVSETVRPGAKLTAAGDVDSAEATMTYTWTFTDTSAGTSVTATGASYTVPADAEASDTVAVAATNSKTNYSITQADALTVQVDKIKSVKLTSTGKVDAPVVGDVITATVDPVDAEAYVLQWYYSDDMKTVIGEGASFELSDADLGKALVAVAEGQGNYAGTSAKAQTGVVKVKVNLVAVKNGEDEIDNDTMLNVGDTIEVHAVAGDVLYDSVVTGWTWKVNGSEPAVDNAYTIQNNDINGDNISVTVAGPFTSDSTLTWKFRGTINQEDWD
jgi:hypothetical protein